MPAQPNILILMADQLTAGVLPAYGGRAKTPVMNALADTGVVFDSFYCNSPLCAPSRFSFLSGQLPSRIGAYDNAADFAADVPTMAHYLRRLGYQTTLSGKMHFCGPDQLHGFEERLTTDIYPSDYGWTPDWSRFDDRPSWYHTIDSVTQAGPCVRTNQIDFDDEVVYTSRQKLYDLARGRDRRPFFLVVSMTHPHDPYTVTGEYWNRYSDAEIPAPRTTSTQGNEDPHSTRLRHVIGLGLQTPTSAQVQAARRAYHGAVSYVDDQMGSILTALKETRLDDNTIVLVLADHGDMLGERGLWYKMNYYEPACRIPLIVSAPGRFRPHRSSVHASLLDILPTVVELGSGRSDNDYAAPIGGRSLVPELDSATAPAREPQGEVIGEYLAEGAIAPIVMIRRAHLKFIHSPADPDQLYDLSTDPDERNNLAGSPAHTALVSEFTAEVARRWSLTGLHAQVLASQRRRHLVYSALREGRFTPWDFQPIRDATRAYVRNDQALDDVEAMARFPTPPKV